MSFIISSPNSTEKYAASFIIVVSSPVYPTFTFGNGAAPLLWTYFENLGVGSN